MTNEIKEILDLFYNEYPKEEKILEKYITILQEDLANYVNVVLHNRKVIDNLQQQIDKAVEYINKYEYQKYCPSPYEKDKYIMREEKEGQDLLNILRGDE